MRNERRILVLAILCSRAEELKLRIAKTRILLFLMVVFVLSISIALLGYWVIEKDIIGRAERRGLQRPDDRADGLYGRDRAYRAGVETRGRPTATSRL